MASTETNILNVDTSKAVKSLGSLRKEIKDLKKELEVLDVTSGDYAAHSQKLVDTQRELNRYLEVQKGRSQEVEGSYYSLNAELVKLRQTYKELSAEERNSQFGQNTLARISELDAQLKDLDASMGQHFRNVGNYADSFGSVFEKMLGPLDKVGGSLGIVFKSVKQMVPAIKEVNSTALTGLSGIKKALAATGIGLVVTLVGTLAANWESVYRWVTGVNDVCKSLENTQKEITEASDEHLKSVGYTVQIMQAQGKSQVAILKYQYQENLLAVAKLKVYKATLDEKIKEIEAHSFFVKLGKGEYALLDALRKNSEETGEKIEGMMENLKGLAVSLKAAEIKEGLDNLKDLAAKAKSSAEAFNALKEKAQDFIKSIKEADLSESDRLKKNYEDALAQLKIYKDARAISEEEYQEAKKLLEEKYRKDKRELDDAERERKKQADIAAEEEVIKEVENKIKGINERIKKENVKIDISFDTKNLQGGSIFEQVFGLNSKASIQAELDRVVSQIKTNLNTALSASREKVAELELSLSGLTEGSEGWLEVQKQITAELEKQNELSKQAGENINKATEAASKAEEGGMVSMWNNISTAIQSTTNLINQYVSFQQQAIQQDVQNGKITEEQAKKAFKRTKSLQYTSIIMQAAMGSLAAMATAIRDLGFPAGPIVGGAAATAIQLSAAIQAATVKKQQYGSLNGNLNNTSTPNFGNITNEYTPQYVQNIQTQSELSELSNALNLSPVVSVVDIEAGLNNSKTRVEETTF